MPRPYASRPSTRHAWRGSRPVSPSHAEFSAVATLTRSRSWPACRALETQRLVAGFRRGVHLMLPRTEVRVGYTGQTGDVTPCERLANRQIDAGARLIFVVARRCGAGASAVAHTRGVRVIGEDEYGINGQPWVLATVFKDWKQAPQQALEAFVSGTLPAGGDLELGVGDNYATGLGMSDVIPSRIQSQVVDLCTRIRLREEAADVARRAAARRG